MHRYIGEIIQKHRRDLQMTQDEYGNLYQVSGPAIFKFEKGFVKPSLQLWMKIAAGANLSAPWAVRIWLRDSLPPRYREHVELHLGPGDEGPQRASSRGRRADCAKCADRGALLGVIGQDTAFPPALREFVEDDAMWALYRPTGEEIGRLRDIFACLGRGSKELYREALNAIRMFSH